MRDIRTDLRERLDAIGAQRLSLDEEERSLRALLRQEERRFAVQEVKNLVLSPKGSAQGVLNDVIAGALRSGPKSVEELKTVSRNAYDFGQRSPGRVVHFTLLGMARTGIIEKIEDKWRLAEAMALQ